MPLIRHWMGIGVGLARACLVWKWPLCRLDRVRPVFEQDWYFPPKSPLRHQWLFFLAQLWRSAAGKN